MNDIAPKCECGKPLHAGQVRCDSCEQAYQSWWKQAGTIAVAAIGVLIPIVLSIVTGGKYKPKA